ncbi:MAG: YqgE/AlgH family protein [Chitinophagaceae bacterium]
MKAGTVLESTAQLHGDFFEGATILITEYNEQGAMGFVTNKIFPRKFNELEEFRNSPPFPLYDGGPVDREHLFFLHQRPDLIEGGSAVSENVYLGGDFKAAVQFINTGILGETEIRLFIGYCGWDAGELEAEIAEGSWKIVAESVFNWY